MSGRPPWKGLTCSWLSSASVPVIFAPACVPRLLAISQLWGSIPKGYVTLKVRGNESKYCPHSQIIGPKPMLHWELARSQNGDGVVGPQRLPPQHPMNWTKKQLRTETFASINQPNKQKNNQSQLLCQRKATPHPTLQKQSWEKKGRVQNPKDHY